jgi:hypothetical protein
MLHIPPPSQNDDPDSIDPDEAREVWRERVLREMAELDLELMRALTHQATARAQAGEAVGDAGLAVSRVSRSLRLTLALEERFAKARRARLAEIAAEEAAQAAEQTPEMQRAAATDRLRGVVRKDEVMQIVEEAIDDEAQGERAEALLTALAERLERPEDEADFADRPIGELAARICRELGLSPDWSLWKDEDWAVEEAESREKSGSPFAPPGWRLEPELEVAAGAPGEDAGGQGP